MQWEIHSVTYAIFMGGKYEGTEKSRTRDTLLRKVVWTQKKKNRFIKKKKVKLLEVTGD